jgi:hypothetical protein
MSQKMFTTGITHDGIAYPPPPWWLSATTLIAASLIDVAVSVLPHAGSAAAGYATCPGWLGRRRGEQGRAATRPSRDQRLGARGRA